MGLVNLLRVEAIRPETADCKTFVLVTTGTSILQYRAGQFLTFIFDKPAGEERRSYSISSCPDLQEPLSVTVKRLENGEYSRKFFDNIQVGDELNCVGATGFFVLPERPHTYQQYFFLAAGSGITPILPLIKSLLYTDSGSHLLLIYSNHSLADTIFFDQISVLQEFFSDRFKVEFLFSISPNLERARLSRWLLPILLKQYSKVALSNTMFYICGPFDYMQMATITLLAEGVPVKNIKKENFTALAVQAKSLPPDIQEHTVVVQLQHEIHRLQVQYPTTILQALKRAGLTVPYSCESGRCGSCTARCISGKVWMSYNEVLMDDELEKGLFLTCTGFPVDGDVQIAY